MWREYQRDTLVRTVYRPRTGVYVHYCGREVIPVNRWTSTGMFFPRRYGRQQLGPSSRRDEGVNLEKSGPQKDNPRSPSTASQFWKSSDTTRTLGGVRGFQRDGCCNENDSEASVLRGTSAHSAIRLNHFPRCGYVVIGGFGCLYTTAASPRSGPFNECTSMTTRRSLGVQVGPLPR